MAHSLSSALTHMRKRAKNSGLLPFARLHDYMGPHLPLESPHAGQMNLAHSLQPLILESHKVQDPIGAFVHHHLKNSDSERRMG